MSKWELMTFMHVGDNPAASDLSKLLDEGWEPFATHEPGIMYFRREKPDRAKERTISKPKTVVEEIWDELHQCDPWIKDSAMYSSCYPVFMALAEAVEWMATGKKASYPESYFSHRFIDSTLGSILDILKGQKTRDIPKT